MEFIIESAHIKLLNVVFALLSVKMFTDSNSALL